MRFQTTRAAELETLGGFRDLIGEACKEYGVDDDACHDLKLAVDEACTNVVTHGYEGMNPGSIMLVLEFAPAQVTVEITDFGHPFEPFEPEAPDLEKALEDPSKGGLGLYFIYQTMDEISYRSGEDGNVLTFIKRLES
jgi:anti-sigma regulatory factor (Ser/Thr protein kinase)